MITKDNIKDLLLFLGFQQHKNIYSKDYSQGDFQLAVDFNKNEIIYPENKGLKVNERLACNFSQFCTKQNIRVFIKKILNPVIAYPSTSFRAGSVRNLFTLLILLDFSLHSK